MKIKNQFELTKLIVRASCDLTTSEWGVLIVIADHVSHLNGWEGWPTIEQIAKYSRLSERTVHRSIKSLVQKKMLFVKSGKSGMASHYKILVEALDKDAAYAVHSANQIQYEFEDEENEPF